MSRGRLPTLIDGSLVGWCHWVLFNFAICRTAERKVHRDAEVCRESLCSSCAFECRMHGM